MRGLRKGVCACVCLQCKRRRLERCSPESPPRQGLAGDHGGARAAELQPGGPAPRADLAGVRAARCRHAGGEGPPGLPVPAEGGRLGAGPGLARVSPR